MIIGDGEEIYLIESVSCLIQNQVALEAMSIL